MTEAPKVFLVHHELDSASAQELARALREEFGVEAWFKGWELLGGDALSSVFPLQEVFARILENIRLNLPIA